MVLRPVLLAVGLLVPALLVLAGCGADFVYFESDQISGAGTTTLIVAWRDAPADGAESVRVTLDRVEVYGPEGTEVLAEGRQVHDLLTLVNGVTARVASAEIPAGRWAGLRFVLADEAGAHTVRVDGVVHVLAFARPGAWIVEVPRVLELEKDATTEVVVDFDVRLSVYAVGDTWFLDPRLAPVDPAGGGGLEGAVRRAGAPVAGATVSAQIGSREILGTRTALDGSFRLHPLPSGTYALVATAPGLAPAALDEVEVVTGVDRSGLVLVLATAAEGGLAGVAPTGRPGLRVRFVGSAGLVAVVGVDPTTGVWELPALAAGVYDVQLWDGDVLVSTQAGVDVTPGESVLLDL